MAAALVPFNPPLGIFTDFCQPNSITLKMQERGMFHGSITGDDFNITDTSGREVCKCKGKALSISSRKVFSTPQGKEVFSLKHKHFTISKSFYGEAPDGKQLFEVKGHFSLMSSKSTIHFTNASTGQPVELELKGDWFDRSAQVTLQGRPVASISRNFLNFGQLVSDRQTYYVSCAPGVDLILMSAICVCLDERENEK